MLRQNKKTGLSLSTETGFSLVRKVGLEPTRLAAPDPKSGASAISPLPLAYVVYPKT